jgi:capsular exopolysaccharide synthesis family protein
MNIDDISKTNDNFERYRERISNFSGEFELGLFLFIAKRTIVWLLLFFITAFTFTFLYLRYTPPIFESSSIIQIKTQNQAKQILDVGSVNETDKSLAEAVEVLRSRVFLKRVLSKLPLKIGYFAEGTFKESELYQGAPFNVDVTNIAKEAYGTKIYIDFENETTGKISYALDGKIFESDYINDKWLSMPHFQLRINVLNYIDIQNQQNAVKKNSFYFVINDSNAILNELFGKLQVQLINEDAKTVKVSLVDYNPLKASEVVAKMMDEFNEFDKETKSKSSQSVIDFINQQIDAVFESLKISETSIQDFKKNNRVNEKDDSRSVYAINRFNAIDDQLINLQFDEGIITKIETKIQNISNIDPYQLMSMLAGTAIEMQLKPVLEALHKLLIQKEEMRYTATDVSEAIKNIDYQINIQKNLLKESIKSLKENLTKKREELQRKSIELQSSISKPSENDIEYNRLMRLFTINDKYYNLLLEKKTEYSISNAGFVSQNIVLDPASPSFDPISPKPKIAYIIAILVALLLGLILIFARYLSHNEISSLNEITKHTQASISILGIIPKHKEDIPVSQLLIDKNPKSLIAEAFRSVRTNLQFISNTPGSKIIALTSTISGEGKTFVAINLAGIIAYSGKKVVIIDLDMRKPKIHIGFSADNSIGMSTLLIGRDILENSIQKSSLENLHFITAGPVPPNPSELIISKKMDDVLDQLKLMYDVIIVDNPPVGLVSDGIAMIQRADYPIYIFRADYSKRNFIQNVDRLFNEVGIKKLSVILNGVDIERKNYGYNYGYGYGYGYGQGYGAGYYDEERAKPNKKNIFKIKYR